MKSSETSKSAEEKLSDLEKSENFYRNLVETSNELIWSVDAEGRWTFLNRQATETIYGYSPEEMLGRPFTDFEPPERIKKDLHAFEDVKTGTPYFKYETTHLRKDGKPVYLSFNARVLRNSEGKVLGTSGTAMNITEQKLAEIALQEKTYELERSNKALEEFAYVASHDLQEPLYIITAFLDNILSQYESKLDEPLVKLLHRIQNAALRMSKLIRELLKYARINTRTQSFEEVDLNDLVKNVLQTLELRIKETKAEIEMSALPHLKADKTQMEQLFSNLLSNALKFRNKSSNPKIKIQATNPHDQNFEIVIEDNGIGFEMEYAERIFQPFQRLHGRSEYEGSGMGLAICQKIVERHHGKIKAESTLNQGARFVIQFPVEITS